MLGRMFAVTARVGLRVAGGDLSYQDEGSSSGFSSWNDASGKPYRVDLSGYATMGLLIRM